MSTNNLYPTFQSAFRQNHSTETALLKVFNDILLDMNYKNVTLLVLLDLGAAFDPIDHDIFLSRLESNIGHRRTGRGGWGAAAPPVGKK